MDQRLLALHLERLTLAWSSLDRNYLRKQSVFRAGSHDLADLGAAVDRLIHAATLTKKVISGEQIKTSPNVFVQPGDLWESPQGERFFARAGAEGLLRLHPVNEHGRTLTVWSETSLAGWTLLSRVAAAV